MWAFEASTRSILVTSPPASTYAIVYHPCLLLAADCFCSSSSLAAVSSAVSLRSSGSSPSSLESPKSDSYAPNSLSR